MAMYDAADLKKGLKVEIDGQPYVITDFEFCKPGKGTALYRCNAWQCRLSGKRRESGS